MERKKLPQSPSSTLDKHSCPAICNTNDQVSSQISEIDAKLNYLCTAWEEDEQLEHQRKFLKCLRHCSPPSLKSQQNNFYGELSLAKKNGLLQCGLLLHYAHQAHLLSHVHLGLIIHHAFLHLQCQLQKQNYVDAADKQ
jgi:hypothetical protein